MNSCELVSFVTAISCGIAKCYPKEELPLLVTVLTQLADTLATIITADELTDSRASDSKEILPGKGIPDKNTTTNNNSETGSTYTDNTSISICK